MLQHAGTSLKTTKSQHLMRVSRFRDETCVESVEESVVCGMGWHCSLGLGLFLHFEPYRFFELADYSITN